MIPLPPGPFRTLVIDPPWPYEQTKALQTRASLDERYNNGAAADIYPIMPMDELRALPVASITDKNAHLYLWTTNSFMVEAHELARAWGFKPKTILTWVKTQHNDFGLPTTTPSMSTGTWYRSATEHVVFCVRGVQRLLGPAAPTAYLWPREPHSVKPDPFYRLVEQQSSGPYIDIFARRKRTGWAVWGNEIESAA